MQRTIQMTGIIQKHEARRVPRPRLQRRDRTVLNEETIPEGLLDAQGMTEDRPERSAVGRDKNRFFFPDRFIEHVARPAGQGEEIFPPRGTAGPSPLYPVAPITGEPAGHVRPGQPLPQAVVALAELRRDHDRDLAGPPCGDHLRRDPRPAQIARVDNIQGNIRQALGQRLGLQLSPGIQGDIGLALDPFVLVPFGLTVTNKIND
jgi:hypothetical protein